MTAVLTRARAELRARVKPMIALTLLVGLGAAAVMTLTAGARRTDTAYPRFARAYNAPDMLVFDASGFDPKFAHIDLKQAAALPQVAASGFTHYLGTEDQTASILYWDGALGTTMNRLKMIEGKQPDPNNIDEVAVSFEYARLKHLHVGSLLPTRFGVTFTSFIPRTLRVVGIEATPGEFPPQIQGNGLGSGADVVHATPALFKWATDQHVFTLSWLVLRFKHGQADYAAVNDELNTLAKGKPQLNQSFAAQATNVQRSIHLQAVALWIVGALIGLIACLILSQLLARQAALDGDENPTLLALGMSRWQVWTAGMLRMAMVGLGGAALGIIVAYFASTLMPIGVARTAEPNPGFSLDAFVLGAAAAGLIIIILLLSAWPVWKSTRAIEREPRARSSRPSLASRTAAAPGLRPTMSTGIRHALEAGRGPTEVPVRSSLLSVTLAIVALVGALTFGASLDHLLSTPRQYGWNWDVHVTGNNANDSIGAMKVLGPDPRVEDVAVYDSPPVVLNGKFHFDLMGLDQKKGLIQPVLVDGRAPQTPGEVALGIKTLRDAHAHIGSTVTMYISAIQPHPAEFKVVGSVVVPPSSDTTRLGTGAVVTEEGTIRMAPPGLVIPSSSDLFVTFAPGVNKKQIEAELTKKLGENQQYTLEYPQKPTDLVNFGQVQNLPLLVAGLVGLLAVATLAHTLVTSIRRRRRDLAILKMLGFVPTQVRSCVAWQATTFVAVAVVIGIPVGIGVGRAVWTAFANQLGTPADPVTPSVRLLLTVPASILLANVIAAVPAVIAGRLRPAPALRAE